jgi:hypothetical protein
MNREQHRRISRQILQGRTDKQIRATGGKANQAKLAEIQEIRKQLEAAGINEKNPILTVAQAAEALGVIPRRVRLLCQEGRLGTQLGGGPWILQRAELIDYLARDHSSGQAGRKWAEKDKQATEGRYGREPEAARSATS